MFNNYKKTTSSKGKDDSYIKLSGFPTSRWELEKQRKARQRYLHERDHPSIPYMEEQYVKISGFSEPRWKQSRQQKLDETQKETKENVCMKHKNTQKFSEDMLARDKSRTEEHTTPDNNQEYLRKYSVLDGSSVLIARLNASLKETGSYRSSIKKGSYHSNQKIKPIDIVVQKQFMSMMSMACFAIIFLSSTPLAWICTYFHEISHAMMVLATGGDILLIKFNTDSTAFVQYAKSGWVTLVAFSGYAGEIIWGCWIYRLGLKWNRSMRTFSVLMFLALLTISNMLFVRDSQSMTILAVIYFMVAMIPICNYLQVGANKISTVFRFVGMYMVFGEIIKPIESVIMGYRYYDARFLAHFTGVSTEFWMFIWMLMAIFKMRRLWILTNDEKRTNTNKAAQGGLMLKFSAT